MSQQQNKPVVEQPAQQFEDRREVRPTPPAKKPFVEPLLSVPVDVLESTTFFQSPTFDTADS